MHAQKTPVSILHEMMIKSGKIPKYDLVYDGGGTHDNTFTYKVSCDGFSATGTGRCKKDAKHLAARNCLEQIAQRNNFPQLPASPGQSPLHEPPEVTTSSSSPVEMPTFGVFHNSVGALQTFCSDNDLGSPDYTLEGDEGPPHAKIFTVACRVSSTFNEIGRARTKKQAKHEVAQKMLDRLSKFIKENNIDKKENVERQQKIDKIVMEKYPNLTKVPRRTAKGVKLKDFHERLKNLLEENERQEMLSKTQKLIEIKNEVENVQVNDLVEELQALLTPHNISVYMLSLPSELENTFVSVAVVAVAPDIMEIGISNQKKDADLTALLKVMESMVILLT